MYRAVIRQHECVPESTGKIHNVCIIFREGLGYAPSVRVGKFTIRMQSSRIVNVGKTIIARKGIFAVCRTQKHRS